MGAFYNNTIIINKQKQIMKRLTIILAALSLCFAACTPKNNYTEEQTEKKVLVTYFSATGTTRAAAERLAALTGADLAAIVPEQEYTEADLNYMDSTSRSSVEMKDPASRPAMKAFEANVADYDVVLIGFPIWWNTAPTIINTFIEANPALAGKTVAFFATSGGSNLDNADQVFKGQYTELVWQKGLLMNDATDSTITSWMNTVK